jgi:hypothetical protein
MKDQDYVGRGGSERMSENSFRVFGAGPVGEERKLLDRAVDGLSQIVSSVLQGPSIIAVEGLTSHRSRQVIEAWLKKGRIPLTNVLRLQPWRSTGGAADMQLLLCSQVVNACRASAEARHLGSRLGFGESKSAELYRWLQSGSWSSVMQAELDRSIRDWLSDLKENDTFYVFIEGIEECAEEDQTTCHRMLAPLLTDHRAIVLLDSLVSSGLAQAWRVDASIEVPTFAPADFEAWIGELLRGADLLPPGQPNERVRRWIRIIRETAYPDPLKAKRIVNDIGLTAHEAKRAILDWSPPAGTPMNCPSTAAVGWLGEPDSASSKFCFMVVLAHRFPALARRLQRHVDGTDALIRLILWSRRTVGLNDADAEGLAKTHYARLHARPWAPFLKQSAVRKLLRDVFWTATPLVRLFPEPSVPVQGGRSAMTSYFWAGRRGLVSVGTRLSRPSLSSQTWWVTRLMASEREPASPHTPECDPGSSPPALLPFMNQTDDWELMTMCALDMVDRTGASTLPNDHAGQAEHLARAALQRLQRDGDTAGELRARGVLAVVLASRGSVDLAQHQLLVASRLAADDKLDQVRVKEFEALVAEQREPSTALGRVERDRRWLDVVKEAQSVGVDDVADRAAQRLYRSTERERLPADANRPMSVFLSYRQDDSDVVAAVKARLKSLSADPEIGISVFYDELLKPGDFWWAEICSRITTADVAIMLLTQSYLTNRVLEGRDDYCYLEANFIRGHAAAKKEGLRALIVDVEGAEWPYEFDWLRAIDEMQFVWGRNRPRGQKPDDKELEAMCDKLESTLRDLAHARRQSILQAQLAERTATPRLNMTRAGR